jgi:hypothetical protein
MSLWLAILVAVIAGMICLEIWGWLPFLSRGVIWLGTAPLPRSRRHERRKEWYEELKAEYDGTRLAGLAWALGLLPICAWERATTPLSQPRSTRRLTAALSRLLRIRPVPRPLLERLGRSVTVAGRVLPIAAMLVSLVAIEQALAPLSAQILRLVPLLLVAVGILQGVRLDLHLLLGYGHRGHGRARRLRRVMLCDGLLAAACIGTGIVTFATPSAPLEFAAASSFFFAFALTAPQTVRLAGELGYPRATDALRNSRAAIDLRRVTSPLAALPGVRIFHHLHSRPQRTSSYTTIVLSFLLLAALMASLLAAQRLMEPAWVPRTPPRAHPTRANPQAQYRSRHTLTLEATPPIAVPPEAYRR